SAPSARTRPPGRALSPLSAGEALRAMALTDSSLVVLLILLALGMFGLIVLGIPGWGNGVARAATRGVEVIALNLLVVMLCGALLNDQYLFYSSWSDLFGARSTQVMLHHGGTAHQAAAARLQGGIGAAVAPALLPPLPQPGARVQTFMVSDQPAHADGR